MPERRPRSVWHFQPGPFVFSILAADFQRKLIIQIALATLLHNTSDGEEAQSIVQKCVHCGFCTAACPTYQLLGSKLDGSHGRIYLMRQVLKGQPAGATTRLHFDRCLTCRSHESTCPSGVTYGCLVEIGRKIVDDQLSAKEKSHSLGERTIRQMLREELTRPALFGFVPRLGQAVRPMLPPVLYNKVPARQPYVDTRLGTTHVCKMLLLKDCA